MAASSSPVPFRFGATNGIQSTPETSRFSFNFNTSSPSAISSAAVETWVRSEYRKKFCNVKGKRTLPVNLEAFKHELEQKRSDDAAQIDSAIKKLDKEITTDICKQFALDENGAFEDSAALIIELHSKRPDLAEKSVVGQVIDEIEKENLANKQRPKHTTPLTPLSTQQARTPLAEQPISARTRAKRRISNISIGSDDSATSLSEACPEEAQTKMNPPAPLECMSKKAVEAFVRREFDQRYCKDGNVLQIPNFVAFARTLEGTHPSQVKPIGKALAKLEEELSNRPLAQQEYIGLLTFAQLECDKLSWDDRTRLLNRAVVVTSLSKKRPDIHRKKLEEVVKKAEELQSNAKRQAMAKATPVTAAAKSGPTVAASSSLPSKHNFPPGTTDADFNTSTQERLEAWIHWKYLKEGFESDGTFKTYKWLKRHLLGQVPKQMACKIRQTVNKLAKSGHKYSFPNPDKMSKAIKARAQTGVQVINSHASTDSGRDEDASFKTLIPGSFPGSSTMPTNARSSMLNQSSSTADPTLLSTSFIPPGEDKPGPKDDLLNRKLNQLHLSDKSKGKGKALCPPQDHDSGVDVPSPASVGDSDDDSDDMGGASAVQDPMHVDMDTLLSDDSDEEEDEDEDTTETDTEIRHAPLVSGALNPAENGQLLPQYGLLGSCNKEKLFLNTNIPFSAFICGVQGSGKSHSTSCILENALIPSSSLGRLEKPLSALVFSYGHFSGDGSGFSISEAAFLASPNPKMPGHPTVRKVQVLVSPSNYVRISRLYLRIPNVTVTAFKLKPWNLDIDIMLTLMNVSESEETPLYMAQVTQILRLMATAGVRFDYGEFKKHIKACRFNPTQDNMLQMRLNLLESFLDMDNSCPEPQFRPGEVTIMDMSCPFVDANTACILFRIGLQRYLQSSAAGKMIVLDEAHKYMLNVPGAKSLNETLLQTIRLQRHYGARIVISTQEPTLLTDLIALCSITIIHRFSSPEWFSAIKRHIPIASQDQLRLLQKIESLKTGTGMVYSPNAVLGRNEDGRLIKGTGRLMEVKVRKRVTSDGGQSVLAV